MIRSDLSVLVRAPISRELSFLTTCLLAGCTSICGIGGDSGDAEDSTEPSIVLSVVAVANTRTESGETIVELNAVAFGGTSPYMITWEIVEGPASPIVPDGASTEVALNQSGTYTVVVTATDSGGESATETIVVNIVVNTPIAPLSASAGSDRTVILSTAIVLEGSASGGEGAYAYEWLPITGLSDPNVAQPTLNTAGMNIGPAEFVLTVTDGTGTTASDAVTITISQSGGPAPTAINSVKWGPDFAGGGYQVLVEFSQTMNQASVETLTGYRINGTATNPTSASVVGNTVTLVFGVAMKATDTVDVSVGGSILDSFGRALSEKLNQAIAANGSDTTAPTISSTTWASGFAGPGYQLTVVFNEAMDQTTAETLANYRINGTAVNPTSASLDTDGKTATLTFTTLALGTANTLDVSLAAAVTDINAQAKTQVLAQAIAANGGDTTAPTISKVRWARNFTGTGYQLTVVFNEPMDQTTAETLVNYQINGTAVNPTSASLDTEGQTVTLTFTTLALDTANTLDVSLAASITDINAQAKTEALAQAIVAHPGDIAAPTISSTTWASGFAGPGYQLTVVFNEAMDQTTAETLANYRINGTAVNPTTASLGTDGKTATLTFTTLALDTANTIDVSLAAAVTDINARAKTQVLAQAITANGETTKPSVVSATETGANQVTVVFNEVMDETTANVAASYTWEAVITTTVATLQANGTDVVLTTSGDPSTHTLTVTTASVADINANTNNAFTSGVFP